ncbi:hypothetical protein, partial [Burkholderia pseudomallei]|uniref:hypothetical protein n=1 Tax=Burkholderia pseudomallei TaxID=28450 RepID=UPI0021F768CF
HKAPGTKGETGRTRERCAGTWMHGRPHVASRTSFCDQVYRPPSGSNVGLAAHFTPHFDGCAVFGEDFGGLAVAGNTTNSGA